MSAYVNLTYKLYSCCHIAAAISCFKLNQFNKGNVLFQNVEISNSIKWIGNNHSDPINHIPVEYDVLIINKLNDKHASDVGQEC